MSVLLLSEAFFAGPFRWFGAVVALVTTFLWVASAAHQWPHFGRRTKRVTGGVTLVLLSIAYGLSEAARLHAPIGPRVGVVIVALTVLLGALAWRFHDEP